MRTYSIPITASLALALAAAAPPAHAGHDEPFRTRNLSPLVAMLGLPVWRRPGAERSLVLTSELANHYRFSRRGTDQLILDGETWRLGLGLGRSVGERGFVAAELSYYSVSGGLLDGVIDGWHSIFGLPDGGRNRRPEGQLVYEVADRDGVFYDLRRRARGPGDLQLALGRRFGAEGRFVLTGTLELPTGDERMLAGNGSTDAAVTLLRHGERELRGRPAGAFWGVGLVTPGSAQRIDFEQKDLVPIAIVGAGWQALPRIGLRAQLDLHGPFYTTPLEELGQTSVQATLGGWVALGQRRRVEFAVNEDLRVSTSPDVVVHASVHWRW